MAEVLDRLGTQLLESYNFVISPFPAFVQKFVSLSLIVFLIVIYSIFIWKFYKFIAKKKIVELNLSQYNNSENPAVSKLVAGAIYFVENLEK